MGNKPTTIEINGKHYDARTGKPLSSPGVTPHRTSPSAAMDITRAHAPSKQMHKSPERSHTLMRHAVKKPAAPVVNNPVVARAPDDFTAPLQPSLKSPLFNSKLDAARLNRAHRVKQSNLVSRFSDAGAAVAKPLTTKVQQLSVQPAPAHAVPASKPLSHHLSNALIAKGLRNAHSHQEVHKPKKARRRSKLMSVAAGGLAVLLLGGFFMYQNIPNVSMRYAAARSGVEAKLPGYKPAGFALSNHIQYSPGQITLSFKSNSDNRNFTITQRESTWNSETLRNNYVANVEDQIHNYEDRGQTIYLYGDSNATWVNGGVWYEINGNSGLNSDQLIRIATSM